MLSFLNCMTQITREKFCFIWNETISNSEKCSYVYHVIKNQVAHQLTMKKNSLFFFHSDICCTSKKKKVLCFYALVLPSKIQSRVLLKGHTQSENDTIHATIASISKNIPVFTSSQWAAVIRTARQAFKFFFLYSKLFQPSVKILN